VSTPRPDWLPADTRGPGDDALGIRVVDFDPDRVVATMPVTGGGPSSAALAESVGTWAARLHAGPRGDVVGVELSTSYLGTATSGVVTAVCTPVRRGRTLATYRVQVSDAAGRPTATARLTCLVRPAG
jgi:uncharacterized protein (TIGR00369 family)